MAQNQNSNNDVTRPVIPSAVGPTRVVETPNPVPKEAPTPTGSASDPERDDANTDLLTAENAAATASDRGTDLPNTNSNRKPGAAPAWQAADDRFAALAQIEPGWAVFSGDGEQLGLVREKGPNWFSLRHGTNDELTMYVPETYIESVTSRRVVLNQPAGLLLDMKLDAPPQNFPGERERIGGTAHDPRRAEPGDTTPIPEPVDILAQEEAPASAGRSTGGLSSEGWTPANSRDVGAAAGGRTPGAVPDAGHTAEMRIGGTDYLSDVRGRPVDSSLQPAESYRDQSGPRQPVVEETVDGDAVAAASTPVGAARRHEGVATRMDAPATAEHETTAWERVNEQDTLGQTFEERSGYTVLSNEQSYDPNDGPTHQAGVRPDADHSPLRTQQGEVGTPGAGQERNVTDLDLAKNKHPDGHPFDSQESTIGRPLAPGEPSIAQRSVPPLAGTPIPENDRPADVPPGAVSRPDRGTELGGRRTRNR